MKSPTEPQLTLAAVGNAEIFQQGQFPFWTATEHGIAFNAECPRQDWLNAVKQITAMFESSGRLHARSMFYLADALNAGERLFGEEYAEAIDNTRKFMALSSKTIQNAMWIAGKVDSTRRRETLTLAHHEAVAKLDASEQDKFLTEAEDANMTVKDLKAAVREAHPGKPRTSKNGSADTPNKSATISTMSEAKAALTQVVNYLKANEDKLTDAWEPLLKDGYRLYRRHWMSGHKR